MEISNNTITVRIMTIIIQRMGITIKISSAVTLNKEENYETLKLQPCTVRTVVHTIVWVGTYIIKYIVQYNLRRHLFYLPRCQLDN